MNDRNQLRRTALALAAAGLVAAVGSVQAAGEEQALTGVSAAAVHSSAGAGFTVEQRLREELSVVMMDLIQSGAFGSTAPQQIALDVEAPPQKVSNLGLLVDSKGGSGDGLHVLAVTPGGNAERMGLRAGDMLVALNGSSLASADGASTLRQTVDALPDGGRLDFNVRRDGKSEKLGGTAASMYLPAMHLSVGAAPRSLRMRAMRAQMPRRAGRVLRRTAAATMQRKAADASAFSTSRRASSSCMRRR